MKAALAGLVPSTALVHNPATLLAQASADEYRRAIMALAGSTDVDALIVIYTPQVGSSAEDVARGVLGAAASLPKAIPMGAVLTSVPAAPSLSRSGSIRLPPSPFQRDAR